MRTVALIEIGGSHDECLLSQMHALKTAGKSVLLITFASVVEQNKIFNQYADETFFVDMSGSKSERSKEVSRIWKKLKQADCEKVILNTAEGNLVRSLCLKALFHKKEFIGIVHNARKFEKSFTQSVINKKIKKYFMLSENLVNSITPAKGLSVDYFYPLRFDSQQSETPKDGKTIVIIGGVEQRRKDLDGFIDMAKKAKNQGVKFIFLGKSNFDLEEVRVFHDKLEENELTSCVTTFDDFVDQDLFDELLQRADLILPLVHPNTQSAEEYFKIRMSGAMCVSFSYKIPMLLHRAYERIDEMKTAGFYYDLDSFDEDLKLALSNAEEKSVSMKSHVAYDVEHQEKRYLEFIFGS